MLKEVFEEDNKRYKKPDVFKTNEELLAIEQEKSPRKRRDLSQRKFDPVRDHILDLLRATVEKIEKAYRTRFEEKVSKASCAMDEGCKAELDAFYKLAINLPVVGPPNDMNPRKEYETLQIHVQNIHREYCDYLSSMKGRDKDCMLHLSALQQTTDLAEKLRRLPITVKHLTPRAVEHLLALLCYRNAYPGSSGFSAQRFEFAFQMAFSTLAQLKASSQTGPGFFKSSHTIQLPLGDQYVPKPKFLTIERQG
jgi:hypothetical protein